MFSDSKIVLDTLKEPIVHLYLPGFFLFYIAIVLHVSCQSKDLIDLLEHLLSLLD